MTMYIVTATFLYHKEDEVTAYTHKKILGVYDTFEKATAAKATVTDEQLRAHYERVYNGLFGNEVVTSCWTDIECANFNADIEL
jgi:hypothetical protein